jgi:hypothetical protein
VSDNLLVPGKYSLCLVPTILLDPDSQKEAHTTLEEDPSFSIAEPKREILPGLSTGGSVRVQMRKIAA